MDLYTLTVVMFSSAFTINMLMQYRSVMYLLLLCYCCIDVNYIHSQSLTIILVLYCIIGPGVYIFLWNLISPPPSLYWVIINIILGFTSLLWKKITPSITQICALYDLGVKKANRNMFCTRTTTTNQWQIWKIRYL